MVELLIDLIGTRLRYPPVPVALLNTLAIVRILLISFPEIVFVSLKVFNTSTTFSEKHKDETLPATRTYRLEDEEFVKITPNTQRGSYGWIQSFIQRVRQIPILRTFFRICSSLVHRPKWFEKSSKSIRIHQRID